MSDGQKRTSDAQRRAVAKWNAANVEKLNLTFKRGHRETWQRAADAAGMTLTQWVLSTLDHAAQDQEGGPPEKGKGGRL